MKNLIMMLLLLTPTMAFSGETMPAGTVLQEDSMVFTLPEAKRMAEYISELENKIEQKEELVAAKDELIENKDEQILSFEEYSLLQEQQIGKYLEIQQIDEKRIKTLERRAKTRKLETAAAFTAGVAVAVTLIIVADQLDDRLIESNLVEQNSSSSARTSGFTVRF